jgi:hypothetical protein
MTADTVLEAAEEKLFRAQRSFARQLLGLVASELRRQHPPEKVLRADPHTGVLHLDLTRA